MVSPFDLSQTLSVGGGLLVPCSLPGPPVVKQLMQMVNYGAWPEWTVSISVLPLTLLVAVVNGIVSLISPSSFFFFSF